MQRTIAAILLYLGLAVAALAQQVVNPMPNAGIYGAYNSAAPTCVSGTGCWVQTDINGNIKVTLSGSGTGTMHVDGNVASAATDSGNPVKIGGIFNTTNPTFTTGQRGDAQLTARGQLQVALSNSSGSLIASVNSNGNTDAQTGTNSAIQATNYDNKFNGSTWDRAFTCPSSAIVNVTAGSTTEIVALTASQSIRICSIAISMSAAGTVTFTSGTGTNCGTGTNSLSGAMALPTGTPLAVSGMNGSLLRPAVSNAFCITAATGNVTGFVTYAKF